MVSGAVDKRSVRLMCCISPSSCDEYCERYFSFLELELVAHGKQFRQILESAFDVVSARPQGDATVTNIAPRHALSDRRRSDDHTLAAAASRQTLASSAVAGRCAATLLS